MRALKQFAWIVTVVGSLANLAAGQGRIVGAREYTGGIRLGRPLPSVDESAVQQPSPVAPPMRAQIVGFRPLDLPTEKPDAAKSTELAKEVSNKNWTVHILPQQTAPLTIENANWIPSQPNSAVAGPRAPAAQQPPPARPLAPVKPSATERPPATERPSPTENPSAIAGGTRVEPQSSAQADAAPVAADQPWQIAGAQIRRLALVEAIQASLASKRVIHSLGGEVVIEPTTLLDPGIAAQQITIARARFDPSLATQAATNHIDRPSATFFGGGIPVANRRDEIEFNTRLSKEWASGAVTSLGYEPSLAYLFFPDGNPDGLNPIQSSDLVLQTVQPLLRNAGPTYNLATIRIAENRLNQSRLDVEAKLQQQLRSIEQVYWQLHAGQVRRHAINDAIALSKKILEIERARFDAGRVIYADVARAAVKLEDLDQQRLQTENQIQQLSLQLSQLSGLPIESTGMLVPSDSPQLQRPLFDAQEVVAVALQRNPTIQRQRQELAVRQTQVQVAYNQLRPQLDLRSSLRSSGLDNDLGTALGDMASVEFVDLSMGLVYTRPIGNRAAWSRYRQAELESARMLELLAAAERQVAFRITESLNSVQISYATFESALRQLNQAQEWVQLAKLRYDSPPDESGQESLLVALLDYQAAIQSRVDALVQSATTLAEYNIQLASVEEQRGTLLDRWRVVIEND